MTKQIQWLVVVLLVLTVLTACSKSTSTSKGRSSSAPRAIATPQVVVGFQGLGQATLVPSPTATAIATATMVPPTLAPGVTPSPTALPTATPTLLPTWTRLPTVTPFVFATPTPAELPLGENCANPSAQITHPRNGQVFLWGATIPVTGTANVDDYQYYKVQYEPEETFTDPKRRDFWGELYANEKNPKKMSGPPKPVVNGLLMEWQTRTVTRGVYYIRLVVHRFDGSYPEPCTVKVVVQ